jgi:uncharacterized protein (TIGR03067 family)
MLRHLAIAALVLAVCAPLWAADLPKHSDTPAGPAAGTLDGKWKVISYLKRGKPVLDDDDTMWFTFTGGDFVLELKQSDKTVKIGGTFTTNPKANPPTMDLRPEDEKGVVRAIYKIEKDKLTLCIGISGTPRPKKFESTEDTEASLLVLERVKKK